MALKQKDLIVAEFLLIMEDKKWKTNGTYSSGETPLGIAVDAGSLSIVKMLLRNRHDIEDGGSDDMTPLWHAVTRGTPAMVTVLLKAGANVDAVEHGQTPLFHATKLYKSDMVKLLLEHRASINLVDNDGKTPLALAVERTMLSE